jgi:hypothetical protein
MMEDVREHHLRAAENQSLFRSVNDRIEEVNRMFDVFTPYASWTCECYQIPCIERIDMTLDEYTAVRSRPTTFAICPGDEHFDPSVERIVERNERYWVVEKMGVSAERAVELSESS